MPLPHQGKVKTFFKEKGYGFIQLDDNQEVFFHVSSVSELSMFPFGQMTLWRCP